MSKTQTIIISIVTATLIIFIASSWSSITKIFSPNEKKEANTIVNPNTVNDIITPTQTNSENDELTTEEVFTIAIDADYAIELNSTEKIAKAAEIMVRGEVIEANSFTINNNDIPQVVTLVKVKVTHDYMEQTLAGKDVYFLQHGGTVELKDLDLPEKDFYPEIKIMAPEAKVNVVLSGVPVSTVGTEVLFFAVAIDDDFYQLNLDEPYYGTVGDYQGRFKLDKNKKQFLPVEPDDQIVESSPAGRALPEQSISILDDKDTLAEIANLK